MDAKEKYGCDAHVQVASDVVGKIAAIAALEVDGVAAMGNNITTELLSKVGMNHLLRNVKVETIGKEVTIELTITIEFGKNIPEVSQKVQGRVKQAVENMTGLYVENVNVRTAGIAV